LQDFNAPKAFSTRAPTSLSKTQNKPVQQSKVP
jgi:hypothetical protein